MDKNEASGIERIRMIHESFLWLSTRAYAADVLEKELGEARKRERDAINELCNKCGRYREEHNGTCDGCRWHHGKA